MKFLLPLNFCEVMKSQGGALARYFPLCQGDLGPLWLARLVCALDRLTQSSRAKPEACFHLCGAGGGAADTQIHCPGFKS